MTIRPQDLTAEELALVDQLALREFDHAETIRAARACYEGCLAFIEARRAFSAPVEQPERVDVGMQCLGCGDKSRPCRCEGYSPGQPKPEESEHDRLIRAAGDCAAAGEHKAAQRFREMAKGLERPDPKADDDGDSCWLGDSCPECNAPELCPHCQDSPCMCAGGPAPVVEGELPQFVTIDRNRLEVLKSAAWLWSKEPIYTIGEQTEIKDACLTANDLLLARSLPNVGAVPPAVIYAARIRLESIRYLTAEEYRQEAVGELRELSRWLASLEVK